MTKKEQLPAPTGHHNLILEDRAKLTLTGVRESIVRLKPWTAVWLRVEIGRASCRERV